MLHRACRQHVTGWLVLAVATRHRGPVGLQARHMQPANKQQQLHSLPGLVPTTCRDVAAAAVVSPATCSRVLVHPCRYPTFEREHRAFDWGIALGRGIAWVKILGISMLMRAVGKTREATLLQNAYTAFSVYNTPRYDRSILSAVDNAAALRVSGTLALHCVPLPQRQQPMPARWSEVLLCAGHALPSRCPTVMTCLAQRC